MWAWPLIVRTTFSVPLAAAPADREQNNISHSPNPSAPTPATQEEAGVGRESELSLLGASGYWKQDSEVGKMAYTLPTVPCPHRLWLELRTHRRKPAASAESFFFLSNETRKIKRTNRQKTQDPWLLPTSFRMFKEKNFLYFFPTSPTSEGLASSQSQHLFLARSATGTEGRYKDSLVRRKKSFQS